MFEFLYEWIENIAFYMIMVTVVFELLPGDSYKKYVRFFTGMILILLLLTPILGVFKMEHKADEILGGREYKEAVLNFRKEVQKQIETID